MAAERDVRRYPGSDHLDVVSPWEQQVTRRVTRRCGRAGAQLPTHDDTYGTRDCPQDVQDRVFLPAWGAHVAPNVWLLELEQMTSALRELGQRITDNVQAALAGGARGSPGPTSSRPNTRRSE